jgi:hypothetical protein
MTTFGQVEVQEQNFTNNGKLFRPFSTSASVDCRGYSTPIQRAITDFGADVSFDSTVKKIKEHYGIEIPSSMARLITENHARKIYEKIDLIQTPDKPLMSPDKIIAETDGCMLPIVSTDKNVEGDKRKTRKVEWGEVRLAFARAKGSKTPFYNAMMGSVDEAGKQLLKVVEAVGRDKNSHIHGVGDGALWIREQFDKQFGSDANYTIDFFHTSEYLAEASKCCSPVNSNEWFHAQQALLKENKTDIVLKNLENHINNPEQKEHECSAIKCRQYIENRPGQFNYKDALDQGLPIGSGEIESGHKFIIQKRMKLSGAWWLKENINPMLALRIIRANNSWNNYWPNNSARESTN